jgi:hypothetical protein
MPDEYATNPYSRKAPPDFAASQEASFRRRIRSFVRSGPFTKSERDVVLALMNHWFAQRSGEKPFIHPGRDKLARKARVAVKTVSRCLDMLRREGAITAVGHLHGLHGMATEYTVNLVLLLDLCGRKKARAAVDGEPNVSTSGRDKMSHRSCEVIPFDKTLARGAK